MQLTENMAGEKAMKSAEDRTAMIWLKRCPRCKGDIQDNRDIYGCYFVCIQCGYYLTDWEETRLRYSLGYRFQASSTDDVKKIEPVKAGAS